MVLAYQRKDFSVMDINLSNIVEYTENDIEDPEQSAIIIAVITYYKNRVEFYEKPLWICGIV